MKRMKRKYCSRCGKSLDMFDDMSGISVKKPLGFGSQYDGQFLNIRLCCECTDEVIRSCRISPITDDEAKTRKKRSNLHKEKE